MKKNLHVIDLNSLHPLMLGKYLSPAAWRRTVSLLFGLIFTLNAFGQSRTVSGVVKEESGRTIPGVSISVKGTTIGMVSDANGRYSLNIPQGNNVLIFSFVGYVKQEVAIGTHLIVNVSLVPLSNNLNEVVVVGYGTTLKKDLTGSVATVLEKDLPQVANASVNELLEGRVAGLDINSGTAQPGGAVTVNIHGYLSQLGNNNPLYVLDGVPLTYNSNATPSVYSAAGSNMGSNYDGVNQDPLSTINPSDIESISVLKDASATAIYGSAAANGVIIVTTKRGKKGKVVVNYQGSYTAETPKSFYTINDLLNGHDFMEQHELWAKEYYLYQNKLAPYGNTNPATVSPYVPTFTQAEINDEGAGYNYMKMIMRDNAYTQEHNISISGGNDDTKIFTSFNYYDDHALLIPSVFDRYSGRVNIDQKIGSRVKFSLSSTYSSVVSNNATMTGAGAEQGDMIGSALTFAPNIAPHDALGNFSKTYVGEDPNPLSFLLLQNQSRVKRLFATPNLEINILDGLKLNITAGIDDQTGLRNMYLPIAAQVPFLPNGTAQLNTNTVVNQSLESYLTYDKQFKKSRLTVVGGVGKYNSKNDGYFVQVQGFTSDAFGDYDIGAANPAMTSQNSYKSEVNKLSGYYRMNYSILDRYIFTLTGRADGSSNFAVDRKWGFFPGAAAAWRVSQESFMKDVTQISDLKVRASYGATGNDVAGANALALYGTIPGATYLIGNTNYPAVTLLQLANPNLTWETDITFDAGIDLSLFKGRITLTYDHYVKTAKNLLSYNNLPYNNPVSIVAANVGTTRSVGNEFDIATKNIISGDFKWSSHITVSHYSAHWVDRNPQYVLQPWETETASLGAVYGFKTDGIIKNASEIPSYQPGANLGNLRYVKVDPNTSTMGAGDVVKLYDTNDPIRLGFGNNLSYKNWDFSIFLYGSLHQYGYKYQVDGSPSALVALNNTYTQVENHWSSFNPSGNLPGIAPDPVNNPTGLTDFGLTSQGWWVRVKDISLGYNLPKQMIEKTKFMKSLRLFIDMQNVALISKIYKDTDPEYAYTYPPALSTSIGVNVGF